MLLNAIAQFGQPTRTEQLTPHNCLVIPSRIKGLIDKGAYNWRFKREGQYLRGIVYVPKVSVHEDLQQGQLLSLLSDY